MVTGPRKHLQTRLGEKAAQPSVSGSEGHTQWGQEGCGVQSSCLASMCVGQGFPAQPTGPFQGPQGMAGVRGPRLLLVSKTAKCLVTDQKAGALPQLRDAKTLKQGRRLQQRASWKTFQALQVTWSRLHQLSTG